MNKSRIIVLGCGFGGVAAAKELSRQRRDDVQIVAFNRTPVLYHYPLLPRLLLDELPEQRINRPLVQLLDTRRVQLHTERVTAIDFAQRTVATATEHHAFDYLIIAPGGKATPLDQDDGFTVYYPKSARHLARLRGEIETLCTATAAGETRRTLMVVGGGLTGIEFAMAIRTLADTRCRAQGVDPADIAVVVIEQQPRLAPHCHPRLGEALRLHLTRCGISVMTGQRVERVHHDHVTTTSGEMPAHRVICCIGSHADLRFDAQGLNSPDGLIATGTLQLTDHPHCFLVGDAAAPPHGRHQETKRASHAIHQGRAAARNLLRLIDGQAPKPYRVPSHPTLVTLDRGQAMLEYRGWCLTGSGPARLKRLLENR